MPCARAAAPAVAAAAIKLVVIGCSAGGLAALRAILETLPAAFALPLVIVQHRAAGADTSPQNGLAGLLTRSGALPVCDACDKQEIEAGQVYLAPPGYHLLIEGDHLALSVDAPVISARPSIDVLFESAAAAWGPRVAAVVLTGMSADGARGAARVKAGGGLVIVQDPASAEAAVMPAAALRAVTAQSATAQSAKAQAVAAQPGFAQASVARPVTAPPGTHRVLSLAAIGPFLAALDAHATLAAADGALAGRTGTS